MLKIEKDIISCIERVIENIFPDCPKKSLSGLYLEIPKHRKFGDLSTNIAMRLIDTVKKPPLSIAGEIVSGIKKAIEYGDLKDAVEDIRIEPPGFINFYLSNKAVLDSFREGLNQGDKYGRLNFGAGKNVQIEFVSANPTGPLTVAHGRQAAVGDALANILTSCGYKVTREYYINDEGVQMGLLGRSVKARFMELTGDASAFPENGYKGAYIYDIARGMAREFPRITSRESQAENIKDTFFTGYASKYIMGMIKKDLQDFGVHFDVWYSQKKLSSSGRIKKVLDFLRKRGFLYEKDGATWFKSAGFGDDKDRVVIKNDGSYTYLAPDIAYHRDKFKRGFHRIINIWGPDHHGYVSRIKAACQALGYPGEGVSILISQLVTLYRDKKPVRMSTREGEFITLRQVIDEVGKDAGRFFFLMRRTDSHLDFDLELAKAKTMDNPVYYIQYAHARIASVIKFSGTQPPFSLHATKRGGPRGIDDMHLLKNKEEIEILKGLMQYPKVMLSSARNLEPYILLSYLQEVARLFHSYYDAYRIVTDDAGVTKARIALVSLIKTVLYSGLSILGVSAPEKM